MQQPLRSLRFESWYPIGAAVFGVVVGWFASDYFDATLWLYSASVAFGAVLTGFTLTTLAMLSSLATKAMRRIRGTSYLQVLAKYMGQALFGGMLLALVGMGGLLIESTRIEYDTITWKSLSFAVWVGAITFSVTTFFRLACFLIIMFQHRDNDPGERLS